MGFELTPNFHMFFVLIATCIAIYSFVRERIPLEVTSIALLTLLLLFWQVFPYMDGNGENSLDARAILSGFANPSLIAVMALLVIGQALIQTDAIRIVTGVFGFVSEKYALFAIYGILIFVMVLSAFVNNTPLVVIAIPMVQALAHSAGFSESRVMIPLSYVAIFGRDDDFGRVFDEFAGG